MAHRQVSAPRGFDGGDSQPETPDTRQRASYEAGESSNSGGRRHDPSTMTYDSTPDVTDDSIEPKSSPAGADENGAVKEDKMTRKRSVRTNGGFLLGDSLGVKRSRSSRIPRRRPSPQAPETTRRSEDQNARLRVASDIRVRNQSVSPQGSIGDMAVISNSASPSSQRHSDSGADQSQQSMDVDSTQIVNMALNLSESRRLASRRNVSHATPPRLATLPASSSAGNELRQQLRQQRRSSRNESPNPSKIPSPRVNSGKFPGTPIQNTFDNPADTSYLYHFSPSTLARAQKAKEQLELMSQYRRLLEEVPPLKPRYTRPVTSSPPGSPLGASKVFSWSSSNPPPLGRKYNPLQYIRNRKVRARERKMIDGEKQGFSDVDSVKVWVDKIHRNTSLSTGAPDEPNAMPVFAGAEDVPATNARSAPRIRRARVDWFIEPCDMIADAYWLEQDNNKLLIEDRNWRKLFSPNSDLSRPMSRDDLVDNGIAPFAPWTEDTAPVNHSEEANHGHHAADVHHNSIAIERAKEKLHHFKDLHPWHSHGHHERSRSHSKKDSASERSDSEREAVNRTVRASRQQSESSASKPTDVLQKQMLEMIAKENKDKDMADVPVMDVGQLVPPSMVTPEKNVTSKPSSRFHSRRESLIDTSDSDRRANIEKARQARSPPRNVFGHANLDVLGHKRSRSREYDSSLPTSPDLLATRSTEPVMGMELSPPWSRPGSPTRNPIKKIKQIIHDKSAEHDHGHSEHHGNEDAAHMENGHSLDASIPSEDSHLSPRKSNTAPPYDGYKGHRRTGSLRNRVDDQSIGLRGMFKGPNNAIRGGVSKLGDILRKKEGSGESHEADTSDESDSDRTRGRARSSLNRSRTGTSTTLPDSEKAPKHFLDTMPEFHHAPDAERRAHDGDEVDTSLPASKESSKLASQNGLLQPPTITARSPSPQRSSKSPAGLSSASETESSQGRKLSSVQEADSRLNSMLDTFPNQSRRKSRQWSIVDGPTRHSEETQLSRREIARMKTLMMSSGIKAMEINRRANMTHKPFLKCSEKNDTLKRCGMTLPDVEAPSSDQTHREVAMSDLYPVTAQALSVAIQTSAQRWQSSADRFTNMTCPELHRRVGGVRSRVAEDLSEMTRSAMDQADETSRGLALDQPLQVKHVVDIIEKMMRRRRRRLRWVRRALWLSVEWLLVGIMWYVWFVVMILRIFLGVGQGIWGGVRWLLWL